MYQNIVGILQAILGPYRKYGSAEYYFYCPFCHHHNAKLAVNVVKGKWQCWKCGNRGGKLLSLLIRLDVDRSYVQELRGYLHEDVRHIKTDDVVAVLQLPSEFKPLWEPSKLIEHRIATSYLTNRNLTPDDLLRYRIGYCATGLYKERVVVPSYDVDGKLNFFVARSYHPDSGAMNYLNPRVSKNIVPFESYVNWNYPVVLCEGVFDAMAIKRNEVPLIGKTVPKKLRERILQSGTKDIYLALDDDALKDTIRAVEQFMNEGLNVYLVEMVGKDPSAIGSAGMQQLIQDARKISFYDLVELKTRLIK